MSTLNLSIWSRCSISPTYSSRSHFLRTLNRKRGGQGRMNVPLIRKKRKKIRARERQEKRRRNRGPILERLSAATLRSLWGQHKEKWLCEERARSNWDPWEIQHPFRPKPNGVGDRTNSLRRLLDGGEFDLSVKQWSGLKRCFRGEQLCVQASQLCERRCREIATA